MAETKEDGSKLIGWHYCGKYNEGDKVQLTQTIKVRQNNSRFLDVIKNKDNYIFKTISSMDTLTITSTPPDTQGGSLESSYYPGTYTLKTQDGHSLIGIPEYLIRSL